LIIGVGFFAVKLCNEEIVEIEGVRDVAMPTNFAISLIGFM